MGIAGLTRDDKTWTVGGRLSLRWRSDTSFEHGQQEAVSLAAHVPGLKPDVFESGDRRICITHRRDAHFSIAQDNNAVRLRAPWHTRLPEDFAHLMYATVRRAWLVHAACIGRDDEGYALLAGAAGSGKTSLTLHCAALGYRVFSADKTLITFDDAGAMHAVAGTPTITVRQQDVSRYSSLPKRDAHTFGDRLAFSLAPDAYARASTVPIKNIFMVKINEGTRHESALGPMSAVHTCYPLFMDKQREDVFIGDELCYFDGAVPPAIKQALARDLRLALDHVGTFNITGPCDWMTARIAERISPMRLPRELSPAKAKKILVGICGIGGGHLSRQRPVLQHLLRNGHTVMVFTYGDGIDYLKRHFRDTPALHGVEVANPYFVGAADGLDFAQIATHKNNKVDFNRINATAMERAKQTLGTPDLVISDYEQISAQYAHAKGSKLVTLDQQSKFLVGAFEPTLAGTSYTDEIERLRLFFPKTAKRLAVSFFKVDASADARESVEVLPAMIREEIQELGHIPLSDPPSLLVYVSSQQLGEQAVDAWMQALRSALPEAFKAYVFLPKHRDLPPSTLRITYAHHGHADFDARLAACHGVVTTAGHTLLSEAMYLEKPVYAVPLPLYEQQLNAKVIADGHFGCAQPHITTPGMLAFIAHLDMYRKHIRDDTTRLFKAPGNQKVVDAVDAALAA